MSLYVQGHLQETHMLYRLVHQLSTAFVADRGILVSLERCIKLIVGVRIQEKVRSIEAGRERRVVVGNVVGVE